KMREPDLETSGSLKMRRIGMENSTQPREAGQSVRFALRAAQDPGGVPGQILRPFAPDPDRASGFGSCRYSENPDCDSRRRSYPSPAAFHAPEDKKDSPSSYCC